MPGGGVPVSVEPLKLSHAGSDVPSAFVIVYVNVSVSASVNARGGTVHANALPISAVGLPMPPNVVSSEPSGL